MSPTLLRTHRQGIISSILFLLSCQALLIACSSSPSEKEEKHALLSFKASISQDPPHSAVSSWSVSMEEIEEEQEGLFGLKASISEDPLHTVSSWNASIDERVEKQALLSFKDGIAQDPLHMLSSWSASNASFPCNSGWAGVTCNKAHRVVSLDLKASNLTGTIHPFLSNLTYLTHLNLSINSLSGLIPPQLGHLTSLTHLDFKENRLTGSIPSELGNCTSLLWLDLSHNQLTGTIPPSLGQLANLYMLQLHDLSNLTGPIPPQLGNLTHLTYLYLGSNNLIGSIPPQLGNLANLIEVYLFINHLNGTIPPELGQLQNLEFLALSINNFDGSIPPHLGNLTNLKYMWCLSCQLKGTIPAELGNLQNLIELDLSVNYQLSGTIPRELGQLKSLQVLKLFQDNLNGSIPNEIGNLKNLQHLYAFSNSLSGEIPPELGQLENLQNLHLYFNQLTGSLPVELSRLQKLQNLILFTNRLSGHIPPELGELKNLSSLYLGDNSFSGNLPSTLGNLENLQYFEVSPNQMMGPIPPTLGKLRNLVYIDLSKNRFSGTLPVELADCTKLQWIKVANNSLSGELPYEFTLLDQLHTLSLANNNFYGSLPAFFANHSSLVVLDLKHNHFSGHLPDSWAQIENLRVLSVGYNHLEGPLPSWLWLLNQLQVLDLSNNNFSGTISRDISQVDGFKHNESTVNNEKTLWYDDVSLELKGTEAHFKYILGVVISLDLSGNRISGAIPNDLGSLTGLFNLNLSHNLLTGPIPSSLGSILTLESLDFSNNLLSGQIPPQLTGLTYLAFLNLSNNQLSGVIPKGNQFSSFTNQSYLGNKDLCGYPLTLECSVANTQTAMVQHSAALKLKIIAGCVSGVAAGMIITALACYAISKRQQHVGTEDSETQEFDKRIKLSARELSHATRGYSNANIIGRGGFSVVYKGILSNGMVVAVKKLDMLSHPEAQKSFVSELTTLGQIRHRNLVKILGTFTTRHFKCLILEYIPNGNLDMHLYKDACFLSWGCRFNIALGVAHGLVYLHDETGFGQVLHCDLKPSNILLDEDFEPHISDFGIARLITSKKDSSASGSVLRGSIGYVAPEYAYGEKLTDKVDVYSYGIVLLEMLTRRRPTSDIFGEGISLPVWVRSTILVNWMDVIDPALHREATEGKHYEIHSVLVLALSCVKEAPRDRPTMREVLDALLFLKQGKVPHTPGDQLIFSAGYLPYVSNTGSSTSSNVFTPQNESSSDAFLSH